MQIEEALAEYITGTGFEDLPAAPVEIARDIILTVLGTTIAGVDFKKESTSPPVIPATR